MQFHVLRTAFCLAFLVLLSKADSFEDLAARAASARAADDIPHAIELYRRALALNPKWQEGWWYLGSLQYDADQYAGARDALAHLIELTPDAAPALGLLGLCEFETDDYQQALMHIQRSLALNTPSQPQMDRVLRYHEALLLTATGNFDEALSKYAFLLQHGSGNPTVVMSMGATALRSPVLPTKIPADQRELYNMAGKAVAFTMSGDVRSAEQIYADMLQKFPRTANVHYLYGCFLLNSNPEQAMDEFRRELELSPSNPAAAAMLSWMLLRRGDLQTAMPYAREAVEGAPKLAIGQMVLGRLLVETGSIDKGIGHLELAEKLNPGFLGTHLSLATAYSRVGRTEDARHERQLSISMIKEPTSPAQP
jgi:tetratricopeptide (TPR) repeat protein